MEARGPSGGNVAALNAMLADARATFQIDSRRIHLAGLGETARLGWNVARSLAAPWPECTGWARCPARWSPCVGWTFPGASPSSGSPVRRTTATKT